MLYLFSILLLQDGASEKKIVAEVQNFHIFKCGCWIFGSFMIDGLFYYEFVTGFCHCEKCALGYRKNFRPKVQFLFKILRLGGRFFWFFLNNFQMVLLYVIWEALEDYSSRGCQQPSLKIFVKGVDVVYSEFFRKKLTTVIVRLLSKINRAATKELDFLHSTIAMDRYYYFVEYRNSWKFSLKYSQHCLVSTFNWLS